MHDWFEDDDELGSYEIESSNITSKGANQDDELEAPAAIYNALGGLNKI